MKWYVVNRRNYLSIRRRIAPDSSGGKTHEEVYLGRETQFPPRDVIEATANTYFPNKPQKYQIASVLNKIKAKREGRKPRSVTITILK